MVKNFFKNHHIHKNIVPHFDYIFIFRPTLFFAVWVMICIGMYLANIGNSIPQWETTFNYKVLLLFISLSLITGATFITNQLTDIISDKKNNKLFLIDGLIDETKAKYIYKFSLLLGTLLLALTNMYNFILGILIFIFWDILYNKNHYVWKKNPFLGPLCNLLVGLFFIFSGWIISQSNNLYFPIIDFSLLKNLFFNIIGYVFCYLSVILLTDIPDIKGDKFDNKKTFTIFYGKKITILLSTLLVFVSFILGIYLNDPLLSIATIVSFPFFLYALFRGHDKDILRSIRYPIFILNFFTFTVYPYLSLISLIVFYISKYYYWHRFDMHYPTFLVNND